MPEFNFSAHLNYTVLTFTAPNENEKNCIMQNFPAIWYAELHLGDWVRGDLPSPEIHSVGFDM
jgi:hypothetical protein